LTAGTHSGAPCADHAHELVGEQFVEKQTGADDDRPVLTAAMGPASSRVRLLWLSSIA